MLPLNVSHKLLQYLQHSVMKFDRSNKFYFCYYGQVNSLRQKSSVTSKEQVNNFGSNIYFAGDGT